MNKTEMMTIYRTRANFERLCRVFRQLFSKIIHCVATTHVPFLGEKNEESEKIQSEFRIGEKDLPTMASSTIISDEIDVIQGKRN